MTPSATTHIARPARQVRTGMSTTGRIVLLILLLVVFEGAVRKWFVPSLAGPLIVLRDLLALYVIFQAFNQGSFRQMHRVSLGMLLWSMCVVGWGLLQLTLGQSNFTVFLIGLRFWLLYLWFAVAAATLVTERDYYVSIRTLLACMILMTPLVILQRYAPPTSVLNLTPDTAPEDIFMVVQGVVRTTGTFTFTAGFTFFLAMCAPFVLGLIEARKRTIRQFLYALIALGCMAAGSLVSGARSTVLFSAAIVALYLLGNIIFAPARRKGRAILTVLIVVAAVAGMLYVFSDAVSVTQERFASASQSENLGDRILATFIGEPWVADAAGVLGSGIGVGSNLGQYAVVGSRTVFGLGETESGRTLLEGGLLGYLFMLLKVATVVLGMIAGLRLALRTRTVFPLLIWISVSIALVTWPVIGQITANGMFGLFFLFALLSTRYPRMQLNG